MKKLDPNIWVQTVAAKLPANDYKIIQQAVALANPTPYLTQSLAIAEVLHNLHLDSTTLAAALLYNNVQHTGLPLQKITEHFNPDVAKLIHGVQQMVNITNLYNTASNTDKHYHNINNLNKMLLAMADDIRVVLIKLAERLCVLRSSINMHNTQRMQLANEIMEIYAPLTHRLGITQIKWELEDLAFRYLEPQKYKQIFTILKRYFPEKNKHSKTIVAAIQAVLSKTPIKNYQVTGRIKHIYSIYRKMQHKNTGFDNIYDISAIRILVPTITDCYTALSHVHTTWQYLPDEFDDYIATPKPNNYRSIHTAVHGPKNRILEIQIRTYDMHHEAELGIAAHWIYKENKKQTVTYEAKIAWLRQLIAWQQEIKTLNIRNIFNDRIYVFTPLGDVLDLPKGATPLDFAYRIHTNEDTVVVDLKSTTTLYL